VAARMKEDEGGGPLVDVEGSGGGGFGGAAWRKEENGGCLVELGGGLQWRRHGCVDVEGAEDAWQYGGAQVALFGAC